MEITVIGFDCGRGVGCFCVSNSRPLDPNKFVNQTNFEFIAADEFGLKKLLSYKSPTGRTLVAIEPTGKDSRVWIDNLKMNGFEVHLVSNNILRHYAESNLGWNNKTDPFDAAALLIYCFDKLLNE
jgi:transposase